MSENENEEMFDKKLISEITEKLPPAFNSLEWSDYVMSKFEDDELEDGRPIASGLIRVVQDLIGPIIDRKIISFTPANSDNYHNATVHVRVKVLMNNESHPLYKIVDYIEQDGIAEVNLRNTPAPFHLHPAASAFTKAEAQAIRKMLCLKNVVAADEVTPEDLVLESEAFIPKQPITPEQINVIDRLCVKLDINVMDLINSGKNKYNIIESVEYSVAHNMIKFLSEIQTGQKQSPVTTKYVQGWRKKDASSV